MKVGLCLNWERLEPSLIEVTISNFVVHQFPPLHMLIRDVLDEGRQIPIMLRPEDHVPMVGHHAVTADSHRPDTQGLGNRIDEPGIVLRRLEDRTPAHGSIEHMEWRSTWGNSMRSWHERMYTFPRRAVKLPKFGGWHLCHANFGGRHLFLGLGFIGGRFVEKLGEVEFVVPKSAAEFAREAEIIAGLGSRRRGVR